MAISMKLVHIEMPCNIEFSSHWDLIFLSHWDLISLCMSSDTQTIFNTICRQWNFVKLIFNFAVITLPADGLNPLGAGRFGPLFTKQMYVLPQDLAKSWSHDIQVKTFPINLKFDSYLSSSTAEMPAKFQSDTILITSNLVALGLHEIFR